MSTQLRGLPGHAIHFFKVIEENSLQNGELRIPRRFVRKYWHGISNPVFLLLPNGAKWEMEWEKRDIDVWLSNDWKKFAEFYSLDKGHFLMFRYEGKSQFKVIILDPSALEIDYPLLKGTFDGKESGNTFETFDGFSPCQRKRPKSTLPFYHSPKKMKTTTKEGPKGAQSRRTKVEKKKFYSDADNAKPKNRGGKGVLYARRGSSKSEAINIEETLEDSESSSAFKRANAFRSEKPFFVREMHPTYIKKYMLVIPGYFITTHEEGSVTLWISSEEINWKVRYKRNACNGQITLSTGWKNFALDNNLKRGDACVFEQWSAVSFRVIIFRARKESSPPLNQAYGDEANQRKQQGFQIQNNFAKRGCDVIPKKCSKANDSEYPRYNSNISKDRFTLYLKPSQLTHASIPIGFIRNYLIHNVKHVTLRAGKKSWTVKFEYYAQYHYGRFSAGWSAFVRDFNLKVGDACHFQLIDEENHVLEVRVTRQID